MQTVTVKLCCHVGRQTRGTHRTDYQWNLYRCRRILERKIWKQEKDHRSEIVDALPNSHLSRSKGRNVLSCAGRTEGRIQRDLKTLMESSNKPPPFFLLCFYTPLHILFVPPHIQYHKTLPVSLFKPLLKKTFWVWWPLLENYSVGPPYLFAERGNPHHSILLSLTTLNFIKSTFLHQLTCQYSPSCACSHPDGKQGRSFSSDSDYEKRIKEG